MEDYIIIAVVLLAAGIGVVATVRHFRHQSGCCGSGGYTPRKKRLPHVLYRKTFRVEGMHCAHCKRRVEEIVNDIKGVAGKVDFKKAELTVSYAQEVDDDLIRQRLARAGYTLHVRGIL